ncbi:MAG: dihydrofolate reductase [Spirochaetales bacterium]|nr:dihydrofolate reductase [Spirochaetales bacterium]
MKKPYRLSLIVAMTEERIIGNGEKIPWRIPEDQQLYKRITMGHPVIMGRKTYQTLPKPFIGRRNIVISRTPASIPIWEEPSGNRAAASKPRTLETASSLKEAIDKAAMRLEGQRGESFNSDEVFIVGGAQIYSLSLPLADRLYISTIHQAYEGDIIFPDFDREEWPVTETKVFEEFTLEIRDRKG